MIRSASDSTVSGSVEITTTPTPWSRKPPDDLHHILLGADIHAARRLAQHQNLRQVGQPFGHADLLLVAAGESAEMLVDRGVRMLRRSTCRSAISRSASGSQQQRDAGARECRSTCSCRSARGGTAWSAGFPERRRCLPGAPPRCSSAGPACRRPSPCPHSAAQLAEERAGQLDLSAAHEAVNAEDLAARRSATRRGRPPERQARGSSSTDGASGGLASISRRDNSIPAPRDPCRSCVG